jgi:hypothetical protein
MLRRRLAVLALAALATVGLLAMPGAASGAPGEATVRVAHFAPGLLVGDVYVVYVNGRQRLKGVPFKTVSDYFKVQPGTFRLEVRKRNAPADSPPVVSATTTVRAGKVYTMAVFGQLTSVKAVVIEDDVSRPASRKAKVRLIQAIPGEQAVDLAAGGEVLVADASSPTASAYQEVAAGRVRVEVRKAGSGEALVPARRLLLPSGSVSSLVVVGGIGEKVELLDVRDAAGSSAVLSGGVATGAGGTAPRGGRRFALVVLLGGGLAAAAIFVVQQRRSSG